MTNFLKQLFAADPECGALCREVQEELHAMRQTDALEAAARKQRMAGPREQV